MARRTLLALAITLAGSASFALPATAATLPPVKHVFVIVEENENLATTFGPGSPAPYLSGTLRSQGAFLSHYYGVGHSSLDNYIAMVSGQAPNSSTSADCGTFGDFTGSSGLDSSGQETGEGCVYPANVPTLMGQLDGKGLTWKGYEDGMGASTARDNPGNPTDVDCGHPVVGTPDATETATPTDQYATRHNPAMYFHSVIDNQSYCDAHDVPLTRLSGDLASASTTPNVSLITPNLCDDGHDATCANGGPGGLAQADTFLKTLVPEITNSPAYKQDGLLIITFDEAIASSDATACCGEIPGPGETMPGGTGPGGGLVGAVLLSPYIKAGTSTATPYNHYSMLGSVEDIFGLSNLAEAKGPTPFGADVFTNPPKPVAPKVTKLGLKPSRYSHRHPGTTVSWTDSEAASAALAVEELLPGYAPAHRSCRVLGSRKHRPAHTRACTVTKTVVRLSHTDKAGSNSLKWNGKVHGHGLAAGHYEVVLSAKASKLSGHSASARFTVT
jgi:hypothetical protein